jgi:hypothetical protein
MLDRIERDHLVGPLTPEQQSKLLEIADKCPVHRTLTSKVAIKPVRFELAHGHEAGRIVEGGTRRGDIDGKRRALLQAVPITDVEQLRPNESSLILGTLGSFA